MQRLRRVRKRGSRRMVDSLRRSIQRGHSSRLVGNKDWEEMTVQVVRENRCLIPSPLLIAFDQPDVPPCNAHHRRQRRAIDAGEGPREQMQHMVTSPSRSLALPSTMATKLATLDTPIDLPFF